MGWLCSSKLSYLVLRSIYHQVALRAAAFGVRLVATRSRGRTLPVPPGFAWVGGAEDIDTLLKESDYVVVACPLTQHTTGLLDARRLHIMKSTAVLINVARGPVVDQDALFAALQSKAIRGAALDVWYRYPHGGVDLTGVRPSVHPFHELDSDTVIMTPHSSGWTEEQEWRKAAQIAANLDAIADGVTPKFVIRASTAQASTVHL